MDPVIYLVVILVVLLGSLLTWDRIIRPGLEDAGLVPSASDHPAASARVPLPVDVVRLSALDYVTSAAGKSPDAATDPGLSARLSGLSEAQDAAIEDLTVYRTREAAIRALVAAGWKVGEIRTLVKGDNAVIGQEVQAARVVLGMGDEEPRRIPIAGGREGYVELPPRDDAPAAAR